MVCGTCPCGSWAAKGAVSGEHGISVFQHVAPSLLSYFCLELILVSDEVRATIAKPMMENFQPFQEVNREDCIFCSC